MKKVIIICIINIFIILTFVNSSSANNTINQKEVDLVLNELLDSLFNGLDDPSLYGFNKEKGEITFGKTISIYTLTGEFFRGNNSRALKNNGLEETKEFLSVIYQDSKPVNVASVFLDENNRVQFGTLGFGKDDTMSRK